MSWFVFFSDRKQEFPKHEDGKLSKYDQQISVPIWVSWKQVQLSSTSVTGQIFPLPGQL